MGRKKKTPDMQTLARGVLAAPLGADDAVRQELEARGVEPNGAGALLYAQWKEAVRGDLKAASFLRDLAGAEEKKAPEEKKPAGKKQAALSLRELSDEQLRLLLEGCGDDGAAR